LSASASPLASSVPTCSYCGGSGRGDVALTDVRGKPFSAVLCDACAALYGSGSAENWRRYKRPVQATSPAEEDRRAAARHTVLQALAERPLRPALNGAKRGGDGQLSMIYASCQWCGISDMVSAGVWARDHHDTSGWSREDWDRHQG